MGGTLAQYMCSLDWPNNELKEKSILITTGAYGNLNKKEVEKIKSDFGERAHIYCFVYDRHDESSYNGFVTKNPDNNSSYHYLPVKMLPTYNTTLKLNNLSIFKLDITPLINTKKITYNNKNFNDNYINITHQWYYYRIAILQIDNFDNTQIPFTPTVDYNLLFTNNIKI